MFMENIREKEVTLHTMYYVYMWGIFEICFLVRGGFCFCVVPLVERERDRERER